MQVLHTASVDFASGGENSPSAFFGADRGEDGEPALAAALLPQ